MPACRHRDRAGTRGWKPLPQVIESCDANLSGGTTMEIIQLINELEAMGEEGERRWYRFVFLGKTMLDAEEYYDLISQLRSALPQEMSAATQITAEREQIIEEAHRERQKIIDSAREQAQLLISNDSLVLEAQNRAKEIVKQAQVEGDAIRAEAEQWARGVVERLESYIGRIAAMVDKTKKAMVSAPPAPTRPPGPRPPA
jgi:F0F1-type ATP synthase membrane subunit b/b'